jgi:hypothetical protein
MGLFTKPAYYGYQFHHRMQHSHGVIPRFTACVQIPSKKQLIKLIQGLVETKVGSLKLKVGISAVNPKDTYSKKIGRELSYNRLEKYNFEIKSALAMNNIHQMVPPFKELQNHSFTNVELRAVDKDKIITVWFKIDRRDKIQLMNVQIDAWPDYSYEGYKKEF